MTMNLTNTDPFTVVCDEGNNTSNRVTLNRNKCSMFGQIISTAITFSNVQKERHESKNAMVLSLNVWSGGFMS